MFTESLLDAGRTLWGTGRQFSQGILALRCHQLVPAKYPASTESCAVADQAPVVKYKEEITTQTPKPSSTNSRERKKRFHPNNKRTSEKDLGIVALGCSCQMSRGIPGFIFVQVEKCLGESREAQCAGGFPSTLLLSLDPKLEPYLSNQRLEWSIAGIARTTSVELDARESAEAVASCFWIRLAHKGKGLPQKACPQTAKNWKR